MQKAVSLKIISISTDVALRRGFHRKNVVRGKDPAMEFLLIEWPLCCNILCRVITTATQPTASVSRFALRNVGELLKLLSLKPDCFWYVSSCSLEVISAVAAMLSGCLG